jgi:predicted MPP superfamily phosphohydrolase
MALRFLILTLIFLLLDWYFYQAVVTVLRFATPERKQMVAWIYWGFSAFVVVLMLVAVAIGPLNAPRWVRVYLFSVVLVVEISKLVGLVFVFTDDVLRLFRWLAQLVQPKSAPSEGDGISRLRFLNQMALVMAAIPFASLLYGMVKGAYDYRVKRITLKFPNLPKAFDGMVMGQISDLHTGSFSDPTHLNQAFDILLGHKPDVIVFTGDLVNDRASETQGFEETFRRLKAPLGVYSTLGNHDYGDYVAWESPQAKAANLQELKAVHAASGWDLLMNEHRILERGGQRIALIGVENWGASLRFPKYGKLSQALAGAETAPFKILLSHDPSHWDAEVNRLHPDVDLTLSGHTHGMQFGVELPGFKWSPVQYFYKQWAGLYQKGSQYLYVNRGLGFIGYPGRVGIKPEITLLEFKRA